MSNIADKFKESIGPDISPLNIKVDRSEIHRGIIAESRKSRVSHRFVEKGKSNELGVESDCVLNALTLDPLDREWFIILTSLTPEPTPFILEWRWHFINYIT